MNTSTQPTLAGNTKPQKSTYRILKDAGFRGMKDFMESHGWKLFDMDDLATAKELIQKMKDEDTESDDSSGEDSSEDDSNEGDSSDDDDDNDDSDGWDYDDEDVFEDDYDSDAY